MANWMGKIKDYDPFDGGLLVAVVMCATSAVLMAYTDNGDLMSTGFIHNNLLPT